VLRARIFQFLVPETPVVANFRRDSMDRSLARNAPDQASHKRSYLSINIVLPGISAELGSLIIENYS
jgi:hypothetical protein